MNSHVKDKFIEAQAALSSFIEDENNLEKINQFILELAKAFEAGNKVLSCGNGGSMCDSMHFAEELTGRFCNDRRALPAIALSDPAHITCTANDFGFDHIFSRMISALAVKGDLLLAISTSGNSPNIIKAVEVAKEKGIKVIGLLGKDGGKLKELVDLPIIVSNDKSERIQEIHIKIIHIVIEGVEKIVFPNQK